MNVGRITADLSGDVAVFTQHRGHLLGLAHRMLGPRQLTGRAHNTSMLTRTRDPAIADAVSDQVKAEQKRPWEGRTEPLKENPSGEWPVDGPRPCAGHPAKREPWRGHVP